jgi:hypothetical protein
MAHALPHAIRRRRMGGRGGRSRGGRHLARWRGEGERGARA